MSDDSVHAVVETLDVDANDAVEVCFGRALDCSDVRDPGIVYKDVDALPAEQFCET